MQSLFALFKDCAIDAIAASDLSELIGPGRTEAEASMITKTVEEWFASMVEKKILVIDDFSGADADKRNSQLLSQDYITALMKQVEDLAGGTIYEQGEAAKSIMLRVAENIRDGE